MHKVDAMNKALPLLLILLGATLLIVSIVFIVDTTLSSDIPSFGESLREWLIAIVGLGVSIKGWMDLLKKRSNSTTSEKNIAGKGGVFSRKIEGVGEDVVGRDKIIQNIHVSPEKLAAIISGEKGEHTAKIRKNPYKGLSAFTEDDAPFFHGREMATTILANIVAKHPPFLTVIGPSGSGKSSLVAAGLLPKLLEENQYWMIAKCRPGSNPLHEIAGALLSFNHTKINTKSQQDEISEVANSLMEDDVSIHSFLEQHFVTNLQGKRLILVIDQFEELYTQCSDTETRHIFLSKLVQFATRTTQQNDTWSLSIIIVLRADFLGQALSYRPLADVFDKSPNQMLGPMNKGELETAILQPANDMGGEYEKGLPQRILDDIGDEAGSLPLLEFALTLLWDRQENGKLTHKAYEALGKIHGALTHYADHIYSTLNADEKELARQIFIQLIQPGEGTEDIRRLAKEAELGKKKWGLVQRLASNRLLVTSQDHAGNPIVEIVHEALIRNWARLKIWMDEDREFRIWQEQFRSRFRQWQSREYDSRALLDGFFYDEAERWFLKRSYDFGQDECEFFELSRKQQSADEQKRREQTEKIRQLQIEIMSAKQLSVLGTAMAALQHRINNTFNIIIPNITRLRSRVDTSDETIREILEIIERNTRYTSDIIRRIQEPLREVEKVDADINAIINEVVLRVADEEIAKTVSIEMDLDETIPIMNLPPGQMVEVIYNLINNAIYAMDSKGKLKVSTQLESNTVMIQVRDYGPGIPMNIQERLFVKPTPNRKGSSGLGLWLNRLILQSLGGEISIKETDSNGTTMLVELPLKGTENEEMSSNE